MNGGLGADDYRPLDWNNRPSVSGATGGGATGATGAAGATGATGAGATGATGARGATGATGADGAPGGGPVSSTFASRTYQGTNQTVISDGTTQAITMDSSASPPAWMDSAGNITAAGTYTVAWGLAIGIGFTTPATKVAVSQLSFGSYDGYTDAHVGDMSLTTQIGGSVTFQIGTPDVPWPIVHQVFTEFDATGQFGISQAVHKIA